MGQEAEAKWWSKDTVAVVTGANKGIGFEIVRQLAKEGITVVLTARDATRGAEAIESLKKQGFENVNFHTLDVGSQESIDALAEWLHTTYGGIDILINNAGILDDPNEVNLKIAKSVLATNYFAVKNVTKTLFPLLRDDTPGGARVIVVASRLGQLKGLPNKDYVTRLTDREHITEDFVDSFVNKYLEDVANGNHNKGDWPNLTKLGWHTPQETYAVSKIAVIAYVSALHNTLVAQHEGEKKINVFSSCPGYVLTDLSPNGTKTVEEGADTPVWLALHSPKEGLGKLYGERTILDF
jgi:carbonyl reductase 1